MRVFWLKMNTILPSETFGGALVIGNLDGIHKGHLLLIEKARDFSIKNRVPFNILTFYPHPSLLFYPEQSSFAITPLRSKLRIFKELGVDNVFLCKFNPRVASLSAEKYVDTFFKKMIKPSLIVVGDDHSFGKNRVGDITFLRNSGFNVAVINRDLRYSSSYIRELIAMGDMRGVYEVMSRYYEIEDFVHHGEKMATKLGFPTANLYIRNYIKPRFGVYASKTFINNEWKNSICYYGNRPTLSNAEPILENHIIDGDFDLYNKRIRVIFVDYIRNQVKFDSVKAIVEQLNKDITRAKNIL